MRSHVLIDEDDMVTLDTRHTVAVCLHGIDIPYLDGILLCFRILLGISPCRQGYQAHDGQNNSLHTEFLIYCFTVIHNF